MNKNNFIKILCSCSNSMSLTYQNMLNYPLDYIPERNIVEEEKEAKRYNQEFITQQQIGKTK